MADKKGEKRRAIVEEISDEPEKEMVVNETETVDETPETTIEDMEKQTSVDSEEEVKHTEPMKVVEAPAPPPAPMNENKMSMKLVVFLTAFIAIIVGGLIGGVIVFINGSKSDSSVAPSPTADTSLETPVEPTAAPTVDKQKYTVDIQNGSGTAGQGAAVEKILSDAGFKVGTVGNAKTFDFTKTVIQIKPDTNKDYVAALEAALTKNYVLDETGEVPTTSKSDIVVIVGSQKAP